jgi:hypothetical protein
VLAACAFWSALAVCPNALAAPRPVAAEGRGVLRIKNNTPFILQVFVAGIRVGWLKPFRTELFKGLRAGVHRIYTHSEYGTVAWGPKPVQVPGQLNITLEKAVADLDTALATRLYKANKASLLACGRLADRRGESVRGTRAEFEVSVDDQGAGQVTVTGEGLSEPFLGCLRTMVKQWKFDATGAAYSLSFTHIN